jgi:hypothetical protein
MIGYSRNLAKLDASEKKEDNLGINKLLYPQVTDGTNPHMP